MRLPGVAVLAAAAAAAAGCGYGVDADLERDVLGGGLRGARAFADDVAASRFDSALARTTPRFRQSADARAVGDVQRALSDVLGPRSEMGDPVVESAAPLGEDGPAGEGIVGWTERHERGAARVRARVVRERTSAPWLVDGYEVRGDVFTWTFGDVPPPR